MADETTLKSNQLLLRLSDRERQFAMERSSALGLSVSAYIRMLINQDAERHQKKGGKK
jgi:predicted DNA binding CopG/RHH family protein